MEPFALVLYLAAAATNPNVPPQTFVYPSAVECEKMKAVVLKYSKPHKLFCIQENRRPMAIAN